jgi:hypothetical protein
MKRLILLCIVLALATAWYQFNYRVSFDGLQRDAISYGKFWTKEAGNPWQYRVVAPVLLWGCLMIKDSPYAVFALRVIENLAMFLLFLWWLTRKKVKGIFIGLILLAWFTCLSAYHCYFSDATYIEVSLFLVAGLAPKRWWAILPIMVMAVLNRETVIFLCFYYAIRNYRTLLWTLPVFGVIQAVLRFAVFPPQISTLGASMSFLMPGLPVLIHNLTTANGWVVIGLIAPLAIWSYNRSAEWWTSALYAGSMLFLGNIPEMRLFLIPLTLGFIPQILKRETR